MNRCDQFVLGLALWIIVVASPSVIVLALAMPILEWAWARDNRRVVNRTRP